MIWKRWVADYLPQDNVRTHWSKQKANVEVGNLVWLVDNNMRTLARIQEIYPAKDVVVRSVLIKTHDGTFKRPVVKVAPVFNERFQFQNGAGIVGASKTT